MDAESEMEMLKKRKSMTIMCEVCNEAVTGFSNDEKSIVVVCSCGTIHRMFMTHIILSKNPPPNCS